MYLYLYRHYSCASAPSHFPNSMFHTAITISVYIFISISHSSRFHSYGYKMGMKIPILDISAFAFRKAFYQHSVEQKWNNWMSDNQISVQQVLKHFQFDGRWFIVWYTVYRIPNVALHMFLNNKQMFSFSLYLFFINVIRIGILDELWNVITEMNWNIN